MKFLTGLLIAFFLLCLPAVAQPQQEYRVKLETSMGDIVLKLDYARAPKTVTNFLRYVRDGYYNGTIFHRVIDGFMIQGGGRLPSLAPKLSRRPIKNEADNGLKNTMYTIAMARTSEPHSATSEFFINVSDNAFLDHTAKTESGWGYAVFGEVVEGRDVVDKIKKVRTQSVESMEDVPVTPVVIEKAVVLE